MKVFRAIGDLLFAVILCAAVSSCTTVGETGRHQLNFMSSAEEMQLGLASFDKMKKEMPISQDPVANALVQKVGRRIQAVANLPDAQWEFVVFESKEINAFCLPGGKIGVYTGILPLTKNEAGMATVIGHEVAHAYAHHGAERISEAMGMEMVGQLLGTGLSKSDPKWQAVAQMTYGTGSQLFRALPHSRTQESEADRIGLRYMARAGYDPEEAVKFWERFAAYNKQASASGTLWFLRTHPLDDTRIKQLKEWLPEAKAQYRPAQ